MCCTVQECSFVLLPLSLLHTVLVHYLWIIHTFTVYDLKSSCPVLYEYIYIVIENYGNCIVYNLQLQYICIRSYASRCVNFERTIGANATCDSEARIYLSKNASISNSSSKLTCKRCASEASANIADRVINGLEQENALVLAACMLDNRLSNVSKKLFALRTNTVRPQLLQESHDTTSLAV